MTGRTAALAKFDEAACSAANEVIGVYSTSFGLATRLLGPRHRQHVRNVYAMVRVADEIVDGVAADAGLDRDAQSEHLEAYRQATLAALRVGYSSDLVLHAFARTAIASRIGPELTEPFFDSMRTDLGHGPAADDGVPLTFDAAAHASYVYGSAEVVGRMCLQVFIRDEDVSPAELAVLERGACSLGAAFQNVNFLRDLADDSGRLGRNYLGTGERISAVDKDRWLATIRTQLDDAAAAIPLLPADARAAVRSAHALFGALADRLERTSVDELYRRRVRVPEPVKLALTARAVARTAAERTR